MAQLDIGGRKRFYRCYGNKEADNDSEWLSGKKQKDYNIFEG